MPLAFKNSHQQKYENIKIEDGFGNYLEVPFFGCMTPNEHLEINEIFGKIANNVNNFAQIQLEAIAAFLRNRFKDNSVTWESLKTECPTQAMIENLYEFMQGEKNQWEASSCITQIKGERAEEVARAVAQQYFAVCATTPSLKLQKTWFIFDSVENVPDSYQYDLDTDVFCEIKTSSNVSVSPKSLSPSTGMKSI
jgi:hypothetical protein